MSSTAILMIILGVGIVSSWVSAYCIGYKAGKEKIIREYFTKGDK